MFLERLVALGRLFLGYGLAPAEFLKLLTDVQDDSRFLANVVVIEIALNGGFRAERLPLQVWGEYEEEEVPAGKKAKKNKKRRMVFRPDVARGLGLPFVRPAGGNLTQPQGRYGLPVYPVFPAMWKELSQSAASFLRGRLDRTENLARPFSATEIKQVADLLQTTAAEIQGRLDAANSGYGLVVLAVPAEEGPYRYLDRPPKPGDRDRILVGESVLSPGRYIVGDLARIAGCFKSSKILEGAEKGTAERCRLCARDEAPAVSMYSKAWSWLAPTWHPPFSARFKKGDKVTDLAAAVGALCADCYLALTVGAGIFKEVSGVLPLWLRRELFLPVASAGGRREAAKGGNVPAIQGTVLVLPLQEPGAEDGVFLKEALDRYRRRQPLRPGRNDRALAAITGFEATLPEELGSDHYRLAMVYYTESNADIHLRAVVEDVLPSVVATLQEVIGVVLAQAVPVRQELKLPAGGWVAERYGSLPYLLVRAYGGCYLWSVLAKVLHRRPLDWKPFVAGAASRMAGQAQASVLGTETARRQNWSELKEEVYFYTLFRYFFRRYHQVVFQKGGRELRDWRELQAVLTERPPEEMHFQTPEELGFAAGYLARQFGRWYYGKLQKDFLRHRVMTFGSELRPDDVWRRALSRFQEYALKVDLRVTDEFRRRAAVVECEYRRLRPVVAKEKDEFIAAFWSGYALALPAEQAGQDNQNQQNGSEAS